MTISRKIADFMTRGSWIRKMFEEGAQLKAKYGAENVFDFTLGNPILPPPASVIAELRRIIQDGPEKMHGYMSNAGYEESRDQVARYLEKTFDLAFTAQHVIMTSGAGGAMNVFLKAILDPGDEVIIIAPYFVEYLFYIDNHGGTAVKVDAGKDFDLDVAAIEKLVGKKTKALIINSPNNPTGIVYSEETLKRLGKMLDGKQKELGKVIFLVNDEPYRKILFDGLTFPSHMRWYRNSLLVTSHSKDFSIPGERIGYVAVNPNLKGWKELIDAMTFANRVVGFVNAPAIWQRVAGACQDASIDIGWYQERRDIISKGLREIGYSFVEPKGAFYFFPRSPLDDDVEFCKRATAHKLLLVPGSGFGTPGYFRIAYSTETLDKIKRSIPVFKKLFDEFKK